MNRFWKAFALWDGVLLLFWIAANLAGVVSDTGLLPFHETGFPFTIYSWEDGREFFHLSALLANSLIAIVASACVAFFCAIRRCRKQQS